MLLQHGKAAVSKKGKLHVTWYGPFYYTEKKTFHPTSCALCHWKKRIPRRVGTL